MININTLKSLASEFHVLYVEDDLGLRETMSRYFEKIFKKVDSAENGQIGYDLYTQGHYDIVISDIEMPVMNGLEMIAKIKEINGDQECIIISAYTETNYFTDSIKLGVSGYIIKPITNDQIVQTLYSSIDKLSRFKENEAYKNDLEELVQSRTESLLQLKEDKIENFEKTLMSFVKLVDNRDTYTAGHSERVATYSKRIAKAMGKSDQECELLYKAGILHDIGKVATPDSILLKPGKLNPLEYELIQDHVTTSYKVLVNIPMYKEIADIIYCHHEQYDGSGYPRGLKGDEIPPLAQIMILADAFDAMTSSRIYKARKDVPGAILELEACSGKQFDPKVVMVAKKVLSSVKTDDFVTQIPETEIEKKRFDYFYKDQTADIYNSNYLDYVLSRNAIKKEYLCINILYLHNFAQYNIKYGWTSGDILLKEFAQYLIKQFPLATVFRIHGDDFVLISKDHLEIDMDKCSDLEIVKDNNLSLGRQHIDLHTMQVSSLFELENLIKEI